MSVSVKSVLVSVSGCVSHNVVGDVAVSVSLAERCLCLRVTESPAVLSVSVCVCVSPCVCLMP